jgi:two-component system chemotaxis response regulator CheB
MIKTLIVDDSKFMRTTLEQSLSSDPEIQVVGTARNGIDALEFLEKYPVDVIVLDFFMPKMDGLETLEHIMKTHPIPTIMITIANEAEYAALYFKALRLGAFDILSKPSGVQSLYADQMKEVLTQKIKAAFESRNKMTVLVEQVKATEEFFEQTKPVYAPPAEIKFTPEKGDEPSTYTPPFACIIIGASTGGPTKVFEMITKLQYNTNIAVVVVQHMPGGFTRHFSDRLGQVTPFKFFEIQHGEIIKPGFGYVAPGDYHTTFTLQNYKIIAKLDQSERVWGVRPCIDYVMNTAAPIFKNKCVGVIITGMGWDGSDGIKTIKKYNGITYAQEPSEALISSMPEKAIGTGCVDYVLPVERISYSINQNLPKITKY